MSYHELTTKKYQLFAKVGYAQRRYKDFGTGTVTENYVFWGQKLFKSRIQKALPKRHEFVTFWVIF
jgi:hypothetical protein